MSLPPPGSGAAFVTGGSSGIGLELARLLAARGHPLALIARDPARLAAAAAELSRALPEARVLTLPCDVGDAGALAAAVARAVGELGVPAYAVACAGIAEPGEFLTQPLAAHEAQMRTNHFGALHLARACAPLMAPGGRLVFVGSCAGLAGIYGYSAYAASKFALRGLAEVLRVELAPRGLAVTLASPPDTDTPQLAAEARLKPEATRRITAGGGVLSPRRVARDILRAADRGRFAATPGVQATALCWLHSLLGPALRAWQGRVVRRTNTHAGR